MLTVIIIYEAIVASIARVNPISLQAHFTGRDSLKMTHTLMVTHSAIMAKPMPQNDKRRGCVLAGFTKLGVTPGGGGRIPIFAATESGI